jgi:hypothetical protein
VRWQFLRQLLHKTETTEHYIGEASMASCFIPVYASRFGLKQINLEHCFSGMYNEGIYYQIAGFRRTSSLHSPDGKTIYEEINHALTYFQTMRICDLSDENYILEIRGTRYEIIDLTANQEEFNRKFHRYILRAHSLTSLTTPILEHITPDNFIPNPNFAPSPAIATR